MLDMALLSVSRRWHRDLLSIREIAKRTGLSDASARQAICSLETALRERAHGRAKVQGGVALAGGEGGDRIDLGLAGMFHAVAWYGVVLWWIVPSLRKAIGTFQAIETLPPNGSETAGDRSAISPRE